MKIAIYGGTFNPPHNTHIRLAKAAVQSLGADKLIVVPGGLPPHKFCDMDKNLRFEMSQIAFGSFAEVSDVEICRDGKTYSSDTVRYFAERYTDDELYFVVGGDSLEHFDEWHEPSNILKYVTLAVAARGTEIKSEVAEHFRKTYNTDFVTINFAPDNVSSAEIRLRYRFGLDNPDVPAEVDNFVRQHGLYAEYRPLADKLRGYLTDKRFMHTFYVVKRGTEICHPDELDKVYVACLLHDCAKYIPQERYADYGFVRPTDMPDSVVHAFLGAIVAKQDFGITDPVVLDAIKYHCTARPDMTRLDKIVYIADKTEQTRPYPLKHLLCGSLDEIFVKCLTEANEYCLTNHGSDVYYLTSQALDFYKGQAAAAWKNAPPKR